MGILDFLGLGSKTNDVQEYVQKGAIILDVRTPEEYREGHIKGSKNIALQVLNGNIETIKKWNKPIIILVHYKGKCTVKTGSLEELKPQCSALLDAGLSAELI